MRNLVGYLFILFVFSAHSYEFKNFKLNTRRLGAFGEKSLSFDSSSNIYDEIENTLNSDYQVIGQQLTQQTLLNYNLGGGVKNYKGFKWNKVFANFKMNIARDVVLDIKSNKWLATDTLILNIKAQTLLSNLKDTGAIEIADDTIAAFAGIQFSRRFYSSQVVDTYEEGMALDYGHLFFAFRQMNVNRVLELNERESFTRIDTLSANTGAVLNIPVTAGLNFKSGAIGKYTFVQKTSAVMNQKLKIESEKRSSLKLGLSADLQLDFFNLLKLSLLSFELSYETENADKVIVAINKSELSYLEDSSELKTNLNAFIKGKKYEDLPSLDKHIVALEKRSKKSFSSDFTFLLSGKNRKRSTESSFTIANNISKRFFSHTDYSEKYSESFLSKLVSGLIGFSISKKSRTTKEMTLLYSKELVGDDVKSSEDFSFSIQSTFFVKSLKRKRKRRSATRFLSYWSGFSSEIKSLVGRKLLKKNFKVKTKLSFKKAGIDYFLSQTTREISKNIRSFCLKKKRAKNCRKLLNLRYLKLWKYNQENTTINMALFRRFVSSVYNLSKKASDFNYFFGVKNIHNSGSVEALMLNGLPFRSFYNSEAFTELDSKERFVNLVSI